MSKKILKLDQDIVYKFMCAICLQLPEKPMKCFNC